jgi:hypothetical protein
MYKSNFWALNVTLMNPLEKTRFKRRSPGKHLHYKSALPSLREQIEGKYARHLSAWRAEIITDISIRMS